MSKSSTSMALNQHRSTLDLTLLFCPTLLDLVVSCRVNNIVLKPPSFEKHLPDYALPLHWVKPLFNRWVGMLEALGVWLLWHAKVLPP